MTEQSPAVVNPDTGELLEDLAAVPPETLAAALVSIRDQRADLRRMETALVGALRERVKTRTGGLNKIVVFGDWEVQDRDKWRREWDADALEDVVRDLCDQGVIEARDYTELIRHKTEVNGTVAKRLEERLKGAALEAIKRCRQWTSSPGTLEVVPSVQLTPTPSRAPLAQVLTDKQE